MPRCDALATRWNQHTVGCGGEPVASFVTLVRHRSPGVTQEGLANIAVPYFCHLQS